MSQYQVVFTDVALKNLKRYPAKDQMLILKHIEQLANNPAGKSNVKKLVDFDTAYRLRVGQYRVLFDRSDILQVIDVIDILLRKQAYRRR